MKKDRNCGATPVPYPTYNPSMGYPMPMPMQGGMPIPMQGGMPMQGPGMYPMPNPNMGIASNTQANDSISTNQAVTAIEQLQAQINNLDRRVSRIESMMQDTKATSYSNNKYTDSNYHMM